MLTRIKCKVIEDIKHLTLIAEMQKQVWDQGAVVPVSQLIAGIHNGSIVMGAFIDRLLVGFCYGFPGYDGTQTYLCSHMLGVHPDYRDAGLGQMLKLKQREWAILHGYSKMVWTYDPLEARNGYLNLCKLGGCVKTYLPSYYGDMDDKLNQGLPSDRFLLEWDLHSKRVLAAVGGDPLEQMVWRDYQKVMNVVNEDLFPMPHLSSKQIDPAQKGYLLPVPKAIQGIKQKNIVLAKTWRLTTRSLFIEAFNAGFTIVGMIRGEGLVHYYVLEK
jgi:predicted GNAT superfamily acetyltransferase